MKFYLQMFWSFFKIGAFTLGGGYAMIPLVKDEVVDKKKWIEEEEFLNMIALAQSAPGVMAVNTAIFVGYKLRGIRGVATAVLGSILPSFMIILLIASVFTRFREYPEVEAVMKGVRPAVVALIAAPLYKMARSAGLLQTDKQKYSAAELAISWCLLIIPIGVALLIWLVNISPIYIIMLTIVAALAIVGFKERRKKL